MECGFHHAPTNTRLADNQSCVEGTRPGADCAHYETSGDVQSKRKTFLKRLSGGEDRELVYR
eukprot:15915-Eustigmatos_ZCMA.PRE.1